ncbi:MAG: serine hydrolase [Bryobacteraceae bacterium]|nr:serine hydrolase [Bryobacteraceae bacterium]
MLPTRSLLKLERMWSIEAVQGKPFQVLPRDSFTRHNIRGFDFDDSRVLVPQRVRGYFIDKNGSAKNGRFYDASNKYPAGGFTASAEQCLRFAITLGSGQVFSAKSLDQMWTAQTTALGKKSVFGLGWGVVERNGQKMVGFNGLQPMTETAVRYFPASGADVALFCNAEGAQGLSELMDVLTEILLGAKWEESEPMKDSVPTHAGKPAF